MHRQVIRSDRISDYYLLTRTYLFIVKRLHRQNLEHFAPRLRGQLLDAGCGFSPYRRLFQQCESYLGIDASRARHPDIVGNVGALPLRDESFDSIYCGEVLEHVQDADRVIGELNRVLRTRGTLLVTVPMSWNLHYEPHDYRRYTSYGLRQALESRGFEILELRRIGGLFALVGSRLVDGIASEAFRRLGPLPVRLRHAIILIFSIPTSLIFMALSRLDALGSTDAIAWAALAEKMRT